MRLRSICVSTQNCIREALAARLVENIDTRVKNQRSEGVLVEGKEREKEIAEYGHGKEKRRGCQWLVERG